MKHIVSNVIKGSLADKYDIRIGDDIIAVNGNERFDIIDLMVYEADNKISLKLKRDADIYDINIDNNDYLPLGISFENLTVDRIKQCCNKCVFCFVDQMPKGMRKSLYVKDDDYRLSFLYGNYITLTNLSQKDLERIVKYQLSPLNVSVHVTDPVLRCRIMGYKKAGDILGKIEYLRKGGIRFNLQFVLCPGYNDGQVFKDSLNDLIPIMDSIDSISCVPVGLTRYRDGLADVIPFNKSEASEIIKIVKEFNQTIDNMGLCIPVCASDEFFVIADESVPEEEYYGDFPQYENGVGMIRSFMMGVNEFFKNHNTVDWGIRATAVTGESSYKFINYIMSVINKKTGSDINVLKIENHYLGTSVTVTGLLCAKDIVEQVTDSHIRGDILIPDVVLNDDGIFYYFSTAKDRENLFQLGTKIKYEITKIDVNQIMENDYKQFKMEDNIYYLYTIKKSEESIL